MVEDPDRDHRDLEEGEALQQDDQPPEGRGRVGDTWEQGGGEPCGEQQPDLERRCRQLHERNIEPGVPDPQDVEQHHRGDGAEGRVPGKIGVPRLFSGLIGPVWRRDGCDCVKPPARERAAAVATNVLASMGVGNPYLREERPSGAASGTGVMAELPDGHAAVGPQARDDDDPDSPGRSFFSRLFRRESSEDDEPTHDGAASGAARAAGARELLVNLRNLRRMRVEDVSVPRAEIVAISDAASLPEVVEAFKASTVSRLPVYGETLDRPLGLVHLKDLALVYGFGAPAEDFDLKGLIRPLLYAPPSMPIGVLLQKMQSARIHMALVIDEYGGVDGLVTIEDLLEQVVGDIADEHDEVEGALWVEEAPGVYLVQARTDLDAFEAVAGTGSPTASWPRRSTRSAAWSTGSPGRVPARGEVVRHPEGHEFEVVDADARRIKRLRVRLAAGGGRGGGGIDARRGCRRSRRGSPRSRGGGGRRWPWPWALRRRWRSRRCRSRWCCSWRCRCSCG